MTSNTWKDAIKDLKRKNLSKNEPMTIILSDYTNKKNYIHFKDPYKCGKYLVSSFQLYRSISPKIRIIRYTVVEQIEGETVKVEKTENGDIISVTIPKEIDINVNLRRQYYRKLYPLFI